MPTSIELVGVLRQPGMNQERKSNDNDIEKRDDVVTMVARIMVFPEMDW